MTLQRVAESKNLMAKEEKNEYLTNCRPNNKVQ
jgi:hypothetical protein